MVRTWVVLGVIGALAGAAEAQPQVAIVSPPPRPALEVPAGAPGPVVAAFELGHAQRRFFEAGNRTRRAMVRRPDVPRQRWDSLGELQADALVRGDRARLAALEAWLQGAPEAASAAHLLAGRLSADLAEHDMGEASAPDYGPARQHLEQVIRDGGPLADAARIELARIAGNEDRRLALLEEAACAAAGTGPARYDGCPAPAAGDPIHEYAWIALAALHLEHDDPALAAAAAEKLAQLEDSPYWPAALYHRAYALYRLDDHDRALPAFDRITREPALEWLAQEAWEYLTLILYGMPDGLDRAEAMFRTDERPRARRVLVDLAALYRQDDNPEQAIRALELALEGWPEHRDLPRTAHQLVELDVKTNGNAHGAVLAVTLVDRLLRGGAWYQANAGDADALARRDRFLETVLLFVGDFFLALAENPKHKIPVPTAQRAGEAFALLLREVPESPVLMHATYGRGRALELQGQLGEARAEYELVRDDAADPDLRAAAEKRLRALAQKR